jgi:hypothetical protein
MDAMATMINADKMPAALHDLNMLAPPARAPAHGKPV